MMLYKLLTATDRSMFCPQVISLTEPGPLGEKIEALGIKVRALGMRPALPNPLALGRLIRWLRAEGPDVIQTWLYHADLMGGLAAQFAGKVPVVWGIHTTVVNVQMTSKRTVWIVKLLARLSGWLPTRIVSCSEFGKTLHIQKHYQAGKFLVIPNGFDTDVMQPDPLAHREIRQALGIDDHVPLIGMIGRFSPEKDHHNFVQAAEILHREKPEVHFLLCGDKVDWQNSLLIDWIEAANLRPNFHLLGRRDDIPAINAALDIATLSSYSEAFPMILGEAMACGVPCVATEVGDARLIIGETGCLVPPRQPEALAAGWKLLLDLPSDQRREMGLAARQRIIDKFSLPAIVERYQALYRTMVS